MNPEVTERARERWKRVVEMKQSSFCYEPVREVMAEELEVDEQFQELLLLSEQARQLVETRGSEVGVNDPMRNSLAGFGEVLDEEIHRRADEVISEVCASYVRQDERWIVDDPDSVDSTEMQAAFDGMDQALNWLSEHEEIIDRLNITYPEDKW